MFWARFGNGHVGVASHGIHDFIVEVHYFLVGVSGDVLWLRIDCDVVEHRVPDGHAVQRQGAAGVGGEGERGLGLEGGGEVDVGDDAVVGLLDGDVAVALGGGVVVAEADEVVLGVGGGLDGDRGAVVYIICIRVGDGGHVGGAGATVESYLADCGGAAGHGNAGGIAFPYCDVIALGHCPAIGGQDVGLTVIAKGGAAGHRQLNTGEVVSSGAEGDGLVVVINADEEVEVTIVVVSKAGGLEGDVTDSVLVLAIGPSVPGLAVPDGGIAAADGFEGAAVGLGEGEGGLVVEDGQEVFVVAGHHEGVAAGVVAHGVVAVDGAEVVRRVGRGGDVDGQAFHDAEAAVAVIADAVGGHRDGAGHAADEPHVEIPIPLQHASIMGGAFEGTFDADSDRLFDLDFPQLARLFV